MSGALLVCVPFFPNIEGKPSIDLERVAASCADACPQAPRIEWVPSFDDILAASAEAPTGANRVATLNRFVFETLGIEPSKELEDTRNLFPWSVLQRKRGYCVGLVGLYLTLAEDLGLPIRAVAAPSHLFLRYDDGSTRLNIETLQRGAHIPDEQYAREHRIPASSIRRGVFLADLTTEQFLAHVHSNVGVIYSERGEFEKAAWQYQEALRLHPRFPAALYNYGKDLLRQGDARGAATLFSKSLRLYATDVWALHNRGLAYRKLEKESKAARDFEAALEIDPAFDPARRQLQELRGAEARGPDAPRRSARRS